MRLSISAPILCSCGTKSNRIMALVTRSFRIGKLQNISVRTGNLTTTAASLKQQKINSLVGQKNAAATSVGRRFGFGSLVRNGALLALPGLAGLNLKLEGSESVIQAVGVLAVIIFVHESGHFLAARLQRIHVSKFCLGFGPKLAVFQGKNVEYSIRAIPLGGYVAFPDEDSENEYSPDDPDLLKNRPILDRVIVISAGVIANVVFAYSLLFTQVATVGMIQQELQAGVMVPEVIADSVAERAGMKSGDLIRSIDGEELPAGEGTVVELVNRIKKNPNHKITFLIEREREKLSIDILPSSNGNTGVIGVQLSPNAKQIKVKAKSAIEAAAQASNELMRLTMRVGEGLKQIILNFSQSADKLSGPVAIVAVGAEVARSDVTGLFQFAAILNLNLAAVNILPLPALDGGYLALLALEAARGKKLPVNVEQGIVSSGVLLMLALGIVLMVRDTLNLNL